MARRRKSSGFEDLVSVAAMLPWWVSVALAAAAFLFFHHFASTVEQAPTTMEGLGSYAGRGLWRVIASFAQWVVPVGLLIGALVSVINQVKTRRRYEATSRLGSAEGLHDMSWQAFEQLVAEHFRRQGYEVKQTGRAGADGGVDVEIRKGTELSLVQVKQWRATVVGVAVVRELYGAMSARGATHAFVVSSGRFSADAAEFVRGRNITLIDGARLLREMTAQGASATPLQATIVRNEETGARRCPLCGSDMVKRVAKKGPNAGAAFLGCKRYPACRGTVPL